MRIHVFEWHYKPLLLLLSGPSFLDSLGKALDVTSCLWQLALAERVELRLLHLHASQELLPCDLEERVH